MERIITLTEEEYNYLKEIVNGLSEMQNKIPKQFKTEKTKLLITINSKYFT